MLENTFFYTFAIGGALLIVQMLMTFLGGDADMDGGFDGDLDAGDVDGQSHSHGAWLFEIISIRTLAAAATFFGLAGMSAQSYGLAPALALIIAALTGFAAMYLVYWMFKQMFKLESSGAQDIRNAIGLAGEVYLKVPPQGEGAGKVHLEMQGRTVEYLAVTDEDKPLPSGAHVYVSDVVNGDTLRVVGEAAAATDA